MIDKKKKKGKQPTSIRMNTTSYFAINAIYFILYVITNTTARSFLDNIDDSMKINHPVSKPNDGQSNDGSFFQYASQIVYSGDSILNKMASSPSKAGTKRAAPDACPVHPDTPAILNEKETYSYFDANQAAPGPMPDENEGLLCPRSEFGDWWPGSTMILAIPCPYTWTTYDSWTLAPGIELYPRYVPRAKCLCRTCVNNRTMGCRKQKRKTKFYFKSGCQGNKPIFLESEIEITVGCYCTR